MLLDSVLNDPALRRTAFVLLHGGVPFDRHNMTLIVKPNVWVDMSVLALIYSADEVARIVRPWLDTLPEHVLFASDAGPFGVGMGWEEATWIASRKSRRALGIALTQLVRDGAMTTDRANAIASAVLRDNAVALYQLK
jgi:predicted TIM-barrel fold metal-dependent hydrolase